MTMNKRSTTCGLLDSDWLYYNQAELLLEKYEDLLELSVKQENSSKTILV